MSTIPTPSGQPYFGTNGNDFLNLPPTGIGLDTLYGFQGEDTLIAGLGSGSIFGGQGNDSLAGGLAGNIGQLFGDLGDDTITAGTALTTNALIANGSPGDDSIFGGSVGDSLRGGKDSDVIVGNDGTDSIYGDDGNDVIIGGALGSESGNTPESITTSGNSIQGNEGDDAIYGAAGNDTIYGGKGNDMVNVDPMMLPEELRGFVDPLHVAGDNDIFGDLGNDTIGWRASTGRGFYFGGEGDDSLIGGAGGRTIGEDGELSELRPAGATPTTATVLGNDTLLGGNGNDTILGSGGNNSLDGGVANDYLVSGLDRDTMTGGEGVDRFVYTQEVIEYNGEARDAVTGAIDATPTVVEQASRADLITDFSTTEGDLIRIEGSSFSGFDDIANLTGLDVTATEAGLATGLTFQGGDTTTPDALTNQEAANRQQLQGFIQGSVRAVVVDTTLAGQYGVAEDSVILYIENDLSLLSGTGTATDPFVSEGINITGTGIGTTPYSVDFGTAAAATAAGLGLTAGDTVLAVLEPGTLVGDFSTAFTERGAANFEFFA